MTIENTVEGATTCTGSTGQECTYTCADGFDDSHHGGNLEPGRSTCGVDSTFANAVCTGRPCSTYTIQFSDKESGSGCIGSTSDSCQVQCNQGYSTSGDGGNQIAALTCLSSGTFEPTSCLPNTCNSYSIPHSIAGTDCTGQTTDTCDYGGCLPGFTDSGNGHTQCLPRGAFAVAACTPNPCAEFSIAHSDHSASSPCTGAMNDACTYVCDAGYHIMPDDQPGGSVACLASSQFEQAVCAPKNCPTYVVANTDPSETCDGTVTETCSFVCAQGYAVNGVKDAASTSIQCLAQNDPQFEQEQANTCLDVDECAVDNAGCDNTECTNTAGSFYCGRCTLVGACCHDTAGNVRTTWPPYEPMQGCCAPDAACTVSDGLCVGAAALEGMEAVDAGCIGPPTATNSILRFQTGSLLQAASTWLPLRDLHNSHGSSAHTVFAAEGLVFTVAAHDENDRSNAQVVGVCGTADFQVTISPTDVDDEFVLTDIMFHNDGAETLYAASFVSNIVGEYGFDVQVSGVSMDTSTASNIVVTPSSADPSACQVIGLADQTEAGRLNSFAVIPRDQYGNLRYQVVYDLSDRIVVQINKTESPQGLSPDVTTFSSSGTVNDDGCIDDPTCASYATIFNEAAAAAAGPCSSWSANRISAVLTDLQLPKATALEDLCPASCQSVGCGGNQVSWNDQADINGTQLGAFIVFYTITMAGDYTIAVQIEDTLQRNAPKMVAVAPIPCHTDSCSGSSFGVEIAPGRLATATSSVVPLYKMNASAVANKTLGWYISLKDQYSNARTLNDSVTVQVQWREWVQHPLCNGTASLPWSLSTPQQHVNVPCQPDTNVSASAHVSTAGYQVLLHTTTSSLHPYLISIGAMSPCTDCEATVLHLPFSVVVQPGPPDVRRHTVNGCLLSDDQCWSKRQPTLTMPHYANEISVVIRDSYDNHRSGIVSAVLSGPPRGVAAATITVPPVLEQLKLSPFTNKPTDVFVQFRSPEEWEYFVHICIDGVNSTVIPFRYGVHSSLNVSACSDCSEFFEPDETEFNQEELSDCIANGCMFTAARDHNLFSLVLETGFWGAHNSTGVASAWDFVNDDAFDIFVSVTRQDNLPPCHILADNLTTPYWLCGGWGANETSLLPVAFSSVNAQPAANGSVPFSFHVEKPGVYNLSISVQQHADSHIVELPVTTLDVAPSAVAIETTTVEVPTRVASHVYTSVNQPDPVEVMGVNLVTGPMQMTDYTIRFQVQLRDKYNNALFGRDRVRLRLCRGKKADATPVDDGNILLVPSSSTAGLYTADFRFSECKVEKACDATDLGLGKRAGLPFGEFVLLAWVCPWHIKECGSMSHDPIQSNAGSCGDMQSAEKPLLHYRDILTKPETVNQANPDGMPFTICPANSATSSGDWNGLDESKGQTGFVSGSVIDTCQCNAGYRGQTGKECSACPQGKHKSSQGNTDCQDCAVGRFCACEPNAPCGPSGEAACTGCTSCPQGRYMNSMGSTECEQCQTGFQCDRQGITYPVALPGYFVDPTDPKEAFRCDLGAEACPGGDMELFDQLGISPQPCTTSNGEKLTAQCINATGSKCTAGYAAVVGAGCPKCCTPSLDKTTSGCGETKFYLNSGQCHPCKKTPPWAVAAIVIVSALVVAPSVLKLADFFKRAGSLQAPIMSLVNFMQSASLFRYLDLHWPPNFKKFCKNIAQIFMFQLPNLPFLQGLHPECAFSLTYQLKWVTAVTSPFLLLLALLLAWLWRRLIARLAKMIDRCLKMNGVEPTDLAVSMSENPAADLVVSMIPGTGDQDDEDVESGASSTEDVGRSKLRSCCMGLVWLFIPLMAIYMGASTVTAYMYMNGNADSGPALYECAAGQCNNTKLVLGMALAIACTLISACGAYARFLRGSGRRVLDWCLDLADEVPWNSTKDKHGKDKHGKDTPIVRKSDGKRGIATMQQNLEGKIKIEFEDSIESDTDDVYTDTAAVMVENLDFRHQCEYLVLVYLLVAYNLLVSSALEPWSCKADLSGKWFMRSVHKQTPTTA